MECEHDRVEHLRGNFAIDPVILHKVYVRLVFKYLLEEHQYFVLLVDPFIVILVPRIILAFHMGS